MYPREPARVMEPEYGLIPDIAIGGCGFWKGFAT